MCTYRGENGSLCTCTHEGMCWLRRLMSSPAGTPCFHFISNLNCRPSILLAGELSVAVLRTGTLLGYFRLRFNRQRLNISGNLKTVGVCTSDPWEERAWGDWLLPCERNSGGYTAILSNERSKVKFVHTLSWTRSFFSQGCLHNMSALGLCAGSLWKHWTRKSCSNSEHPSGIGGMLSSTIWYMTRWSKI